MSTEVTSSTQISPTSFELDAGINANAGYELDLPRDVSIGLKIEGEASVNTQINRENGRVIYSAEANASVTVNASVNTSQAGASITRGQSVGISYEVDVPEDIFKEDMLATINPMETDSIPVGTRVTMSSSSSATSGNTVMIRNVSASCNVSENEAVSMSIFVPDESTAVVTIGDSRAVSATNSLGVGNSSVSATLSNDTSLAGTTTISVEFDISTPEGRALFDYYVANGELPSPQDPNAPGINSMTKTEVFDYDSDSKIALTLGPLHAQIDGPSASTNCVTTTNLQTGEMSATTTIQQNDGAPLRIDMRFDADGNELRNERTYTLTMVATEQSAAQMNMMASGGTTDDAPVQPGDTVEIVLTQSEAQTYIDTDYQDYLAANTESDGNVSSPLGIAYSTYDDTEGYGMPTVERFIMRLTQSDANEPGRLINDMYTISSNPNAGGPVVPDTAFPGTIRVIEEANP